MIFLKIFEYSMKKWKMNIFKNNSSFFLSKKISIVPAEASYSFSGALANLGHLFWSNAFLAQFEPSPNGSQWALETTISSH